MLGCHPKGLHVLGTMVNAGASWRMGATEHSLHLAHWSACFSAGSTWSRRACVSACIVTVRILVSVTERGPPNSIIRKILKRLHSHLCHLFHFGVLLASCCNHCNLSQLGYAFFVSGWLDVLRGFQQMHECNWRQTQWVGAPLSCLAVAFGNGFTYLVFSRKGFTVEM